MKKVWKSLVSLSLALIMFSGLSLPPYAMATGTTNDPFTAMYDSDAMFKEKIAPIL